MEQVPGPITMDEAHEVVMSYLLLFRHGLPLQLEEGIRLEQLEEAMLLLCPQLRVVLSIQKR